MSRQHGSGSTPVIDDATARTVKERHEARLMAVPGVHGVAIGNRPPEQGGGPAILVFHSDDARLAEIPREIDGVPVVLQRSAPFQATASDPS
jgi:hypothetical protein